MFLAPACLPHSLSSSKSGGCCTWFCSVRPFAVATSSLTAWLQRGPHASSSSLQQTQKTNRQTQDRRGKLKNQHHHNPSSSPSKQSIQSTPSTVRQLVNSLLRSDGTQHQLAHAARAINAATKKTQHDRDAVVRAGALKPLVQLLRTHRCAGGSGKNEAAAALARLAGNGYADAVAAAGALKPLVQQLSSGDVMEKSNAALAIANVASCQSNASLHKDRILEIGALNPLVDLLHAGHRHGSANAAVALANLVRGSQSRRDAVINARGALEKLCDMACDTDCDARMQMQASRALSYMLMGGSEALLDALLADGTLSKLVSRLHDTAGRGREYVVDCMSTLKSDRQRDAAFAAGAMDALVALLRGGSVDCKTRVVRALSQLSYGDNAARVEAIMDTGALDDLVAMLHDAEANLNQGRMHASHLIAEMAYNGGADAVVEAGAVAPLVSLLSDHTSRGMAALALANIARSRHQRDAIVAADGVVPLERLAAASPPAAEGAANDDLHASLAQKQAQKALTFLAD